MYQIIGEYLEYLELEKGLSQNTIDAYRRDLSDFAQKDEVSRPVSRKIQANSDLHCMLFRQQVLDAEV